MEHLDKDAVDYTLKLEDVLKEYQELVELQCKLTTPYKNIAYFSETIDSLNTLFYNNRERMIEKKMEELSKDKSENEKIASELIDNSNN